MCSSNCKVTLTGETCDRQGQCIQGCKRGFYGQLCTDACPANCKNDGKSSDICDRRYGRCSAGCSPGWFGWKCNSPCYMNCAPVPEGKTPVIDCSKSSNCLFGCLAGWKGDTCGK
ncbi:hypothetical protein SNE40_003326 [Patella caerulea]|uniref:Laminin EGF-like domain-containing protein n=1 Tax=Patella caerulea TaxID=87958 RepID=A0AAN8KDP3_PATCE